jgi:hypothetical protein
MSTRAGVLAAGGAGVAQAAAKAAKLAKPIKPVRMQAKDFMAELQ